MSDTISQAKQAREILARALGALQSDPTVPPALGAVAEPVAQAMGALHAVERTGSLATAAAARDHVRAALSLLQSQADTSHAAVATATESVAGSLGIVFGLVKAAEAAAAAPIAPQPPVQPVPVQPIAQPAPQQPAWQQPTAQQPAWQQQPAAPQPAWQQPAAPQPLADPYGSVAQPPAPQQPAPQPPAWQQPAAQQPTWQQPAPPQQPAQPSQAAYPQTGQQAAWQQAQQPAPQQPTGQQAAWQQQPAAQQPAWQQPAAPQPTAPQPTAPAPQPQTAWQQPAAPAPVASAPTAQQPAQPPQPAMSPAVAPPGGIARFEASLGINSATNFYKGLSGNDVIEHGGIFVATYAKVPPMGTPVALRVALPGGYEFEALATIAWVRERAGDVDMPPGFGARFTQISSDSRQLVYRYTRNREPLFHDDL